MRRSQRARRPGAASGTSTSKRTAPLRTARTTAWAGSPPPEKTPKAMPHVPSMDEADQTGDDLVGLVEAAARGRTSAFVIWSSTITARAMASSARRGIRVVGAGKRAIVAGPGFDRRFRIERRGGPWPRLRFMLMMRDASRRGRARDRLDDGGALAGAVRARDRSWDGRFVFAVRTTGVYCRPSCPARRPRAGNVSFFADPDAAEQAGFRACRRCRPRETGAADARAAMVRRGLPAARRGPRPALAPRAPWPRRSGVSPRHLLRTFKDALGVTPRQYADARRMAAFKGRLREEIP